MRSYILRCALFVAIGLPPLFLMWAASLRYPPSFQDRTSVQTVRRILMDAEAVQALTVGNSHARAIEFDYSGADGHDLGLPWTDLFEVEHQMRTLVPRLPELEVVFIALSYFSFHWDNQASGNEGFLNSRRIFYAAAPTRGWVDGDRETFVAARTQWLTRPDLWRSVLLRLAGRDPYDEQREAAKRVEVEVRSHQFLAEHAQFRVSEKIQYMDTIQEVRPDVSAAAYDALSAAIRFLQNEGIDVVLYTPPYYRKYTELFAADTRTRAMRQYALQLEREHGVRWLDFSRDPLGAQPSMFRDSDHLNAHGRRLFSRKLLDRVCGERVVRASASLCG